MPYLIIIEVNGSDGWLIGYILLLSRSIIVKYKQVFFRVFFKHLLYIQHIILTDSLLTLSVKLVTHIFF